MALVESVKYALSSSPINQSAKKPVIFVKLTDSALRAIEDYLRLQQKTGQHATIQFLGNEGRIHIPSSHTPDGCHSFDFSLSPNTDIEGPQGSFECIQQCGPRSLQSMGTLPFKMRIHAKDDVYTTTRERFRFNEDKRKQESAKEIEQPSAENGPRVKKRFGGGQRIQRGKASPPFHNNYSQSKSPLIGGNSNSNTYSSHGNGYHQPRSNGINTHARGIMNRPSYVSSPDITRRPLRERLIHMLAVKPLKKPEVMERIHKQGLKGNDKKMLMMVLQQVSQLKDNVYNLSRGIWNDVQEDWPFYTEEERQIMKRRKPQNLTPPGSDSSVGSGSSGSSSSPRSTTSGSGNSPTSYTRSAPCDYPSNNSSHHNQYSSYGAPAKSNSNYSSVSNNGPSLPGQMTMQLPGTKRGPNFFDSNNNDDAIAEDGGPLDIPTKKQRVSFFKKPNCSNKDSSSSSNSANNLRNESRESPNPNKELPPHVQGSSYAPHTQHQRVDKSLLHPNVMINNIPERLSPSLGAMDHQASNHKSPRNLKDHHSPTYNSLSNNQNNKSNHHGSNHMNSGQANHHGEDFVYSSSAINNSVSGNDLWPSNGFGHQGNQLHHPRNNISSVSVNLDNDFELNLKLPDTNESDPITDCGQSAGSFNASVNHNHNHGSQSQHSANVNVSQVFSSSSSSSLPSYGSSIDYSSSSKDVSAISVTKRDHDGQGSGGPSLLSGGSRVSSSTAAVPKNAAPKDFLHSSEPNLSSQVDMLHHLNGASALRSDSGREKEDRSSSVEVNEIQKKMGDGMQSSGSLKNRPANVHRSDRSGSRDRPKERGHGDRLKERTKERDLEKASRFDKSSYLANYTTIRTSEQRNRYKADFSAEYDEYRNLHSVIDKVSKKFAHLAERLRKEEKGSTGYQMIRDEIIREYHYNKNNKTYTDARAKYAYLHDKLSHIKQLVSDYDALNSTDTVSALADEDADY